MSLRLQTAFQVQNLPDEQNNAAFEVIMPEIDLKYGLGKEDNNSTTSSESSSWVGSAIDKLKSVATGIGSFMSKYTPIVEEINFTPRSFKVENRRVRTGWINFATDLENMQQAEFTFFCSNGMLTQYYLDAWNRMIFNPNYEYFNPVSFYKKDIHVYFNGLGSIGVSEVSSSAHFTMKGAFPVKQGSYKLAYSKEPERLRLSCTFVYDRLVPDESLATKAIVSELVTSGGVALIDKGLTALNSDTNGGSGKLDYYD